MQSIASNRLDRANLVVCQSPGRLGHLDHYCNTQGLLEEALGYVLTSLAVAIHSAATIAGCDLRLARSYIDRIKFFCGVYM